MVLNLNTGEYFELCGAAPLIWTCLDGETTMDEVIRKVATTYGVDERRVRPDLEAFVSELAGKGLLGREGSSVGDHESPAAESFDHDEWPAYEPPSITDKGNLKYLGQLD